MAAKEKMLQARQLIQEKRYREAQQILKTVSHPTAKEWLEKLDTLIDAEKPVPRNQSSIKPKTAITISLITALIIVGFALASVFLSKPGDEPDVPGTETAVVETIPSSEPVSDLKYSTTVDNPIPAGQPIVYNAGTLRVMEVHYPVGFALYSGDSYAPLTNNNEFAGVKFEFQCSSTCNKVPEADLSLITSDGSAWDIVPVFSLAERMLYNSDNNVGWLYFRVPNLPTLSALRVTNEETSLFVSLPSPVNGYLVDTRWESTGENKQELRVPKMRRLLDNQYPVEDVTILSSNDLTYMSVPVILNTLYFENEQQVVDAAFPIITTISSRWDEYNQQDIKALHVAFLRSTDRKVTAHVIIDTRALDRYAKGDISANDLISTFSIELQETPPSLGDAGNNQSPTEVPATSSVVLPSPTPNISTQNTTTITRIPQTTREFEQYLLSNYSNIAGQSLPIERVSFSSGPFIMSIILDYERGGWEIFSNQTRLAATDYAERLTQDVEAFFKTNEDILVTVSYSYHTDDLRDYHYNDEWWYIGDYDVARGWYVSMDFVSAFFHNGSWDINIWNYK